MKNGQNYYLYIVQCSYGWYYTGVTNDLERRQWQHQTGYNESCYTFKRRPVDQNIVSIFITIITPLHGRNNLKEGQGKPLGDSRFHMNRPQMIKRLASQPEWDVCIIGGGDTGLGAAVAPLFLPGGETSEEPINQQCLI